MSSNKNETAARLAALGCECAKLLFCRNSRNSCFFEFTAATA